MTFNEKDAAPEVAAQAVEAISSGVEVTAPMDLQEGYQLQIQVDGESKVVSVPPGGVKKGDVFMATPIAGGTDMPSPNSHVPMNQWRDGLCDCFTYGCCHPVCCLGYWFGPILLGQVMTRTSRNWLGGAGSPPSKSKTFVIVTSIFAVFVIIWVAYRGTVNSAECSAVSIEYDPNTQTYITRCTERTTNILSSVLLVIMFIYGIYVLITGCLTRAAIREKFNIPSEFCGEFEDCCCIYWCFCCSVTQMARHTHDYHDRDVACCSGTCMSKTGQPEGSPEIV